jgi:hypothetical protein
MRIEISRRIVHVKRKSILATLLLVAIALLSIGCGTGDKIGSVSMQVVGTGTGTVNLQGLGGTLQLQVLANYTSGKQIDETNFSTFAVTPAGFQATYDGNGDLIEPGPAMPSPPSGFTIDKTGMVTAVAPGVCSWTNEGTLTQPGWAFTGYYQVVGTYRGFSSNPVFVPLASAAGSQPGMQGECGPTATGQ